MADGRDLVLVDRALEADVAGAAAFADSTLKVLIGKTGDTEIVVAFGKGDFEWSPKSANAIYPTRRVKNFFLGVRTQHEVAYCGYIAHSFTLVTLDVSQKELSRFTMDEIRLYQRHP